MALLFIDGFDHYDINTVQQKWTGSIINQQNNGATCTYTIGSAYGRVTGNGFRVFSSFTNNATTGAYIYRTFPNRVTTVTGCAFRYDIWTAWIGQCQFIRVADGLTIQLDVRLDSAFRPQVTRNGTVLFTGVNAIQSGTWNYFELMSTINATTGYAELRVNGVPVGTFTGNTSGSGNNYANQLALGPTYPWVNSSPGNVDLRWDDVYLLEADSSAGLVTFLGDCRVQTLLPNGPGTNSGMISSAPVLQSQGAAVTVVDTQSGSNPASNITDGNTLTYWRGNTDANAGSWFYIDLGSAIFIDSFILVQVTNISGTGVASQFRIEYSANASTWTTSFVSASGLNGSEYQTVTTLTTPQSARYWRFITLAGAGQDWAVYEAQLFQVNALAPGWQAVNELIPDTGTSVYGNAAGMYDTYQYPDLVAATNRVYAVAQSFEWRKDDAGSRTATMRVRSGGFEADFPTPVIPLTGSYAVVQQIDEVNPVTSVPWVPADVNSAEFGPKIAT